MRLISSAIALALTTSAAFAGDIAPLSPGAPAGVKHAQDVGLGDHTILYIALGAAVIAGIAIAASSGNDAAPTPAPPATSTSTSTTTA